MELDDNTGFEELEGLSTDVEADVSDGPESIEESIAIAFEEVDQKAAEAKAKNLTEDPEETKPVDEKPKSELSEAASRLAKARKTKGPKQVVEAAALDVPGKPAKAEAPNTGRLIPPDDWDVKIKEEFNGLPPAIQKRSLDFYSGMKANATKALQELNRHRDEAVELKGRYSDLAEIADYYAPRWGLKGQSVGQVARELFAAQEVINQNPEFAIATLIKKNNANYDKINAYLSGDQIPNVAPVQPAQQNFQMQQSESTLTIDRLEQILAEREQRLQQSAAVTAARTEIESLKHQTSADGRTYLYPELHNPDDVERLKPLVDEIRESQPGITWTAATKEAVLDLRALRARRSGTPSSNVARLPSQQEIQRARQASVSIRGRGNAAISTASRAPKGESVEDSLRAVWGGNNGSY